MGAIHAVMQGQFQVVLVYFREASAFVSMTNTAITDIIGFTLNKTAHVRPREAARQLPPGDGLEGCKSKSKSLNDSSASCSRDDRASEDLEGCERAPREEGLEAASVWGPLGTGRKV